MIELKGKYNNALVYTDNVESTAVSQIIELCNQEFCEDSHIRIMPDTHAGKGCTIGTTMLIRDKVVPNLVGVDIGCGMEVAKLREKTIDFEKFDEVVRKCIPMGQSVRGQAHKLSRDFAFKELRCAKHANLNRAELSLGTLGGGNHFIEVAKDSEGYLYLIIHSGSRYLGKQVAEYYQDKAFNSLTHNSEEKRDMIEQLKKEGREKEIHEALKSISKMKVNKHLAYLEGEDFDDYIHDMKLVQKYAVLNRQAIVMEILDHMDLHSVEEFTTIHNYIDTDMMILRKGAISARKDEKVIIPINMSDGSLLCMGKGNSEWNYSAPHGAGRLFSRAKAKEFLKMDNYENSMEGIWTSSVCEETLDESKEAYKPIDEIIGNIGDTVDIIEQLKPVYNLKDSKPSKKTRK